MTINGIAGAATNAAGVARRIRPHWWTRTAGLLACAAIPVLAGYLIQLSLSYRISPYYAVHLPAKCLRCDVKAYWVCPLPKGGVGRLHVFKRHLMYVPEGQKTGCAGHRLENDDVASDVSLGFLGYPQEYIGFYDRWLVLSAVLFATGLALGFGAVASLAHGVREARTGQPSPIPRPRVSGRARAVLGSAYCLALLGLSYWVGEGDGAERAARALSNEHFRREKDHVDRLLAVSTNLAASAGMAKQARAVVDVAYGMLCDMDSDRGNSGNLLLWYVWSHMRTNDFRLAKLSVFSAERSDKSLTEGQRDREAH